MKKKAYFGALVGIALVYMHPTDVIGVEQESYIITTKRADDTSGQLEEKLVVLLEGLALSVTHLIEKESLALKQLLRRMHEMITGESTGSFAGASSSQLRQRIAKAEELRKRIEKLADGIADLNKFLKKP